MRLYLCYALGCLVWFRRESLPLTSALRRVTAALEPYDDERAFTGGFESYRSIVDEEPLLRHQWNEFVESLVFPTQDSGEPLRNTSDPGQFLSNATLIVPQIHTRFFQSVPSQLTALGILGTFVGLAAGIALASGGLTSKDADEVTAALQRLLGGASLAFITSIFGIFWSLVFLMYERAQVSGLDRERQAWVTGLERRLRLVTLEELGLEQLREAKEQSAQLKKFNTDLVFALESALEEKVAGKLAPILERPIKSVEELRQDRSTDSTKVIENMLGKFVGALQERTDTEFDNLKSTLKDLSQTLQKSSQSIADDLSRAGKNASSEIASSLDGFREGMQRLEGASTSLERLVNEMGALTDKFGGLRQTISESHQHVQDIVAPTRQLADALQKASADMIGIWGDAGEVVQQMSASVDSIQRQQEQMAAAWESHESRFADIDASLANSFREMNEALDRYTDKTLGFAQALDQQTGKALELLGAVTGELNETLEGLQDSLSRSNRG